MVKHKAGRKVKSTKRKVRTVYVTEVIGRGMRKPKVRRCVKPTKSGVKYVKCPPLSKAQKAKKPARKARKPTNKCKAALKKAGSACKCNGR